MTILNFEEVLAGKKHEKKDASKKKQPRDAVMPVPSSATDWTQKTFIMIEHSSFGVAFGIGLLTGLVLHRCIQRCLSRTSTKTTVTPDPEELITLRCTAGDSDDEWEM